MGEADKAEGLSRSLPEMRKGSEMRMAGAGFWCFAHTAGCLGEWFEWREELCLGFDRL